MLHKRNCFLKTLTLLLSALSLSAEAKTPITSQPLFQSTDYRVYSTDEYTRLEIINVQKAHEVYNLMRLPELEQADPAAPNNKFKSFSNSTSDFFFFCGTIENSSFACYFQIKKLSSDRLFESLTATSLKLTSESDSKKWSEILPAQDSQDGRNISALIIENQLETYCEKSSANDEVICHVTIYKNEKAEPF